MSQRITIDPITRIEGHLRIDVDVDGGHVNKAWSSGQMWRGVELILLGRDPRDAWAITQRICGVCTTVHAITSVRAVENALQAGNAAQRPVHPQPDHPGARGARPHRALLPPVGARLGRRHLGAEGRSRQDRQPGRKPVVAGTSTASTRCARVQERLKPFVNGGQLGIFTNGYWGHPAMKLSPEVNLLAVAHYLQALEVQRKANKIVSILGSKTPHIQNVAVGGVANPLATDSQSVLTVERLMAIKGCIDELADFVKNVYLIDVAAVGAFYADWTKIGEGVTNYLSVPDIPLDTKGTQFAFPGGYIDGGDLANYKPIKQLQRRVLASRASKNRSSTPGTTTRTPSRCIPTRARPSRTTPTSRTTASIPGSSRRPSTASWRRSGRWRAC